MIGKQIGKYQIQELLGRGGMGHIYKATHPTLERDVAIKVIQIDQTSDPTLMDRFRREAQVVAALRHPGIIQVYDFDIEGDILYMVMEFVQGESLAQRLAGTHAQGRKMPLEESLRIFKLIADAVAYAHRHGVIHRDLKPGNVLLRTDGQPILTDFGISKVLSGQRLTVTGHVLGTPHYMSPEQAAGGEIGPYTDVYALGVMLYEMATGTLPFKGDTSMTIVFKHVNEPPPRPRALNPHLPESVEQFILKAMAKDPTERFASAQELLEAAESLSLASPSLPCLFICHKPNATPDKQLAAHLHQTFVAKGYRVCDPALQTGKTAPEKINEQIKTSQVFILLLSAAAAESEMIKSEIAQAYALGVPHIITVRLAYDGLLPYALPAQLQPAHYLDWHSEADTGDIVEEILSTINGKLPPHETPAHLRIDFETSIISEDGRLIPPGGISPPPLPAFDPRFLRELAVPGGAVKLRDRLYIERKMDVQLKDQIVRWGTTTTIRAPRQTGKTSLLIRGIHHARQQGTNVVFLDFQSFGSEQLSSPDLFLQEFAHSICDELNLDEDAVEQAWRGARSPTKKLTRFMEKFVLPFFDAPVVLAMDEADGLLQTGFYKDFFGLLRSWHNRRASREVWEKLNLVLVISTEPYLLIDDIHQSPFNVGLHLGLTDFDAGQVHELNRRHGSPVTDHQLPELMTLLNGHPFLTRLALYTLVTSGISWNQLKETAPADDGPFGDHLRHQYWIIHDKPDLKNALKDIILTRCCPDEKSLFRLLQAGLIKGSGDLYTCRCDLYKQYFEDRLFQESDLDE